MGLLLVIVPWSSFWDQNLLLEAIPALYDWTRSPYVRGAVSGLGLVNMAAGLAELTRAWRCRHELPGSRGLVAPFDRAHHR